MGESTKGHRGGRYDISPAQPPRTPDAQSVGLYTKMPFPLYLRGTALLVASYLLVMGDADNPASGDRSESPLTRKRSPSERLYGFQLLLPEQVESRDAAGVGTKVGRKILCRGIFLLLKLTPF